MLRSTSFPPSGLLGSWKGHYVDPFNRRGVNLYELSLILCPAQVVLGFSTGTGGFIMYSIVAALNAGLFALVGLVVVSLWNEPPDNTLRIKR